MLQPNERALLSDALRPPAGHALDLAVGTTFSLDLFTLMQAPLAFTFFSLQDQGSMADPLALLESLRRHADRMLLFCQGGRIAVPRAQQTFFAHLENSVVQIAPLRGVFHPKTWLLRFSPDDAALPMRYRLLVSSRNLSRDRSWDTLLTLEGELADRRNAFAANHPLGDFIQALPGLASEPMTPEWEQRIQTLQHEVRRVRFTPPEGFSDDIAFHPLGIPGYRGSPIPDNKRPLLVIAPFVSQGMLRELAKGRDYFGLVTREEEAWKLPPSLLQSLDHVWSLMEEAQPEPADAQNETESVQPEAEEQAAQAPSEQQGLEGLHAKLYVMDDGWDARLWTGSANATAAAFQKNVEFLVELKGKRSACGIDAMLGSSAKGGLISLLEPITALQAVPQEDPDALACERLLEDTRLALARTAWIARVYPAGDEAQDRETCRLFAFSLEWGAEIPDLDKNVRILCRPASLGSSSFVSLQQSSRIAADFGTISFEALTCFMVFDLEARAGTAVRHAAFAIKTPLSGAPENRRERLLQAILRDKAGVLRLMLLMLRDFQQPSWKEQELEGLLSGKGRQEDGDCELPLLETMLKALHKEPERLDAVARLVQDLRRTAEGAALLPEGLEAIWPAIWNSRQALQRQKEDAS